VAYQKLIATTLYHSIKLGLWLSYKSADKESGLTVNEIMAKAA